jgi:hypothetical protein
MGFREDFAALVEVLELEREGVADFLFDFGAGSGANDAAGQIGGVGGVSGAGFFDDDEIFFHDAGKASQSG